MRSSVLLLAVSSAAASVLPVVNLPASAFPKFATLSHADAINGLDLLDGLLGNSTASTEAPAVVAAPTVLTETAAQCAANPSVRPEWSYLSVPDRQSFVASIKCLINKPPSGNFAPATNRFEDLARLHQLFMPNVHGNAKFLVWHRYFLWTFEQILREECGLTTPFPWWDETKNAGNFAASTLFSSEYFGFLTGANSKGDPVCVTSGAFAGLTAHIGPGSSNTPHCLSRAGSASLTAECNAAFVNTCNSRASYADMESCSEGGPHAYGHDGIGGVMADVSASPSDPIFYMHHSFIDHSFSHWQNGSPTVRTTTINGVDHNGNALTMDTVVGMGGLRPDVTIADILNTESGFSIGGVPYCYRYTY